MKETGNSSLIDNNEAKNNQNPMFSFSVLQRVRPIDSIDVILDNAEGARKISQPAKFRPVKMNNFFLWLRNLMVVRADIV